MKDSHYIFMLLHRYNGTPEELLPIEVLIGKHFSKVTVITPDVAIPPLSTISTDAKINMLLTEMDNAWHELKNKQPDLDIKIILIGHSLGGLFARKLYICACGENARTPIEEGINARNIRPWSYHVERIILLAAVNNGWSIDYHLNKKNAFLLSLGSGLGQVLAKVGKEPTMLKIKKGGVFVTQLRLQSIEMQNQASKKNVGDALTIQLLGTSDDVVSPMDNVDLICGGNFIYLEIPYSGHKNVIDISDQKPVKIGGQITTAGAARTDVLLQALKSTKSALQQMQLLKSPIQKFQPDRYVTDVVFIIHGIRDEGFWTQKIANRVMKEGNSISDRKFETETSTYGYFPLLDFVRIGRRKEKVAWLMEQYAENMAKYPEAKFSFIGHSNGTYLLAKAMQDYPACKFNHVLFAGSVVNMQFDWDTYIQNGRINKVHNIAATNDWVVGIFPQALHYLFNADLGAAGYHGFQNANNITQSITIPGEHDAGIQEEYWDSIAHFIIHGQFQTPLATNLQNRVIVYSWWLSIILLILGIIIIFSIGFGGIRIMPNPVLKTTFFLLYAYAVYKFLSRF